MASQTVIERLRAGGIVMPKACVAEAARAGLRLELAAALLEKESAGGHNVFGHDRDRSGRYIFPARDGSVKVTKELYLEYKRRRVASGDKAMQGVGPCQLTWFSFQDDADKLGGCWKPQVNMRVGFQRLASLVRTHGDSVGARMYNGSGDAAVAYSADLLKKAAAWKARLDGAAPVPASSGPLRRGDRGPRVARLTRRLARARSKAGTPYLAKPRRELDATVEAALKAFQAEHRLEPDGIYGPHSQRKLNRVLRLQQKLVKPSAAPAERRRTQLKPLVVEVLRHDAETGEAWEALAAHAAKRRRLLAHLQAKKGKAAAGEAALQSTVAEGFAAVTAALQEIDGKLDALVSAEAASEVAPAAVAAVPDAAGGGGAPPAVDAPEGATVVQAAPPPPPVPEGPAPPSPAAAPRAPRRLTDLSDAELLERIERLDRALDRARAAMIGRFVEVERELASVAPERAKEREPDISVPPGTRPQAEAEAAADTAVGDVARPGDRAAAGAERVHREAAEGDRPADDRRDRGPRDQEADPRGEVLPRLHRRRAARRSASTPSSRAACGTRGRRGSRARRCSPGRCPAGASSARPPRSCWHHGPAWRRSTAGRSPPG